MGILLDTLANMALDGNLSKAAKIIRILSDLGLDVGERLAATPVDKYDEILVHAEKINELLACVEEGGKKENGNSSEA